MADLGLTHGNGGDDAVRLDQVPSLQSHDNVYHAGRNEDVWPSRSHRFETT